MREAITVLTQITAPWLRGHYDLTQLHIYLDTIVDNITGEYRHLGAKIVTNQLAAPSIDMEYY